MNMNNINGKWYKIGEVARILEISVETIRMYEREGILLLEKTETGQRQFNSDDVHWIGCIRRLIKEKGLNIEGIRRLLSLLPCWMLRPCSEEEKKACPTLLRSSQPCWTMKNELSQTCRTDHCHSCNVYQSAIHCDNLKRVFYQMEELTISNS